MATIGTHSFSRLVCVKKNKTGEAVDLRQALANREQDSKVIADLSLITPQLEALRTFASCALSGGSVAVAGAGGTGKTSLLYILGRMLTVDYPGDEFTALGDVIGDSSIVRSLAGLRTSGRTWLLVVPELKDQNFVYAMRGALNGALLASPQISEFIPESGSLSEEYERTAMFIKEHGDYDGIVILGDNFDAILDNIVKEPEGDNARAVRDFMEFCSTSSFPVLFVATVEREFSALSSGEEEFLIDVFQKVQPLTLLGKDGEWENLVTKAILEHPNPEVWDDVIDYKDFRAVVESTVHQGIYSGNSDKWISDTAVCGAYPLHPAALFALPRVAMNLSSNAKTAFRFFTDDAPGGLSYFLNNYAVLQPNGRLHLYTVDWLCTYFEKVILKDEHNSFYMVALQNAILAAGDVPQSRRILRLIMIMQLIGHDRLRPQLNTILWALHLGEREERTVRHSLDLLVQKKALVYSEKTGEYLLPVPRREVNVPQSIQRSRNRMRAQLDLRQELEGGLPTLRVKATGYNRKYNTDRSAAMRAFLSADIKEPYHFFEKVNDLVGNMRPYRGDMLFAFIIPDSEEDMSNIISRIESGEFNHKRLVMVIPKQAHRFAKEILEVRTLEHMLSLEPPFSDPTTKEHKQINGLLDQVTASLDSYAESLVDHENLYFFYNGKKIELDSHEQMEEWLDSCLPILAGTPPLIASPQLMALVDNGAGLRTRQQLISYLLATRESFAIRSDARNLKKMVERGLVDTGILKEESHSGFWTHYVLNNQIPNEGLGKAFNTIASAIKACAEDGHMVSASDLFTPWMHAPYAMTPALMELILAVVLWHWPREVKLSKNRIRAVAEDRMELLQEVKPCAQVVSDIIANPSDWMIGFCEADVHKTSFLNGICHILGIDTKHEGSYWVYVGRALLDWYNSQKVALRESSIIKDPELLKFNRFFVAVPSDDDGLCDWLEKKLPLALGEPEIFSWIAEADDMVSKLADRCARFTAQLEDWHRDLAEQLSEIFYISDIEETSWQERVTKWIERLPSDISLSAWKVEYVALENAIMLDENEALDSLISDLGYSDMASWKFDHARDIVERLSAMRQSLDWEQYIRGYRLAGLEVASVNLGLAGLKMSGLSDEGATELIGLYLQAMTWPESLADSDSSSIAQSTVEAVLSIVNNTDEMDRVGDWLCNDDELALSNVPLLATEEQIEDDIDIPVGIDFLEEYDVSDDSGEDEDIEPEEQPSGGLFGNLSIASLVSNFGKIKSGECEAVQSVEEYDAPISGEPNIPVEESGYEYEYGNTMATFAGEENFGEENYGASMDDKCIDNESYENDGIDELALQWL